MKFVYKGTLLCAYFLASAATSWAQDDDILKELLRIEQEQNVVNDSLSGKTKSAKDSVDISIPSYKHTLNYKAEAGGVYQNGDYLPSYMINNRYGLFAPENSVGYTRAGLQYSYNNKSFQVNAEADFVGYITKSAPYYNHKFHIQQLFTELYWKKWGFMLGSKELPSMLVSQDLSSGNMVFSNNCRPMPQFRIGTLDYVNISGTKKWLSIYVDFAYGKTTDKNYNEEINNLFISQDKYRFYQLLLDNTSFHRKNIFFRTNPSLPVAVTLGFEHYAQFGGDVRGSFDGGPEVTKHGKSTIADGMKVFFFSSGKGENEYNHLASVDLRLDINATNWIYSGYTQLYYDEFKRKGLCFRFNGSDGIWGIELKKKERGLISDFVFEYIQTSCQNGPVLSDAYTGMSNYYNDQHFGAYAHYGMSCGSPLLVAPVYNQHGDYFPGFTDNLVKVWHFAFKGNISKHLSYRAMISTRNSWGTPFSQYSEKRKNKAGLLDCSYENHGWTITASAGFDKGSVFGDNWGYGVTLKKCGTIFNK